MKHLAACTLGFILLVGCGEAVAPASGDASGSQSGPVPLLSMEHYASPPRGALQIGRDGYWLYTSKDACTYIEGELDAAKVGQITQWLADESLKPFATKEMCAEDQYLIGGLTNHSCVVKDVASEGGKALIQLFHDTASKVMWDGMERECMGGGPGTIEVSDKAKRSVPKPPVAEAGSGG